MQPELTQSAKEKKTLHGATVRFAGDSGDGMQLVGVTSSRSVSGLVGNDVDDVSGLSRLRFARPQGTTAGCVGFSDTVRRPRIFIRQATSVGCARGDEPGGAESRTSKICARARRYCSWSTQTEFNDADLKKVELQNKSAGPTEALNGFRADCQVAD
jgi:hypothetical protein